jgi:cell division protein FtsI (penicillin-binding protein 3)
MTKKRNQHEETLKLFDHNPHQEHLRKSQKRALVLVTVIFFCFGVIAWRLVDLMILDHDKLSRRAAQQYQFKKTLSPQRGVIWDRNMREMATNIDTYSLYAVPKRVKDTRSLAREISPLVKVSYKELNRTLLKKRKREFVWVDRKMEPEAVRNVRSLMNEPGYEALGFKTEAKRFYPKGRTASHILGFTDIDNRGISGLELYYNKFLKGNGKKISVSTDARGNSLSGKNNDNVSGNNLLLTIDEGIQHIVERELSKAIDKWKAKAAVAIMMDPSTGEILAMSNRPTYDANLSVKVPGSKNKTKFNKYWGERRNRAITDIFEPGSTLKSMLAAAAVEERVVKLDDMFDVSKGYIVVGGKRIKDSHKIEEDLSFAEVIQRSSNVGAVKIAFRLGEEKYYDYLKKFGFGEKTGIDFPGEARGILRETVAWSGTSLAAISIGQEIGTTPLQVIRAYAAIANGGLLMKPYVVSDIISPSGDVIKRITPKVERRVVSRETAETVKDILKMVVQEGGTATQAYVQGNLVAGKTGTAQIFDHKKGRYSRSKYVSSFVGFVPADDPKIALIVVVYEPQKSIYGGVVAGPVFKEIVEHTFAYLNVPMERDANKIFLVSKTR